MSVSVFWCICKHTNNPSLKQMLCNMKNLDLLSKVWLSEEQMTFALWWKLSQHVFASTGCVISTHSPQTHNEYVGMGLKRNFMFLMTSIWCSFLPSSGFYDYRGGYLNMLYAGESFSKALRGRDSTVPILTTKKDSLE